MLAQARIGVSSGRREGERMNFEDRVSWTRDMSRRLLGMETPDAYRAALDLVRKDAEDAMAKVPAGAGLRSWQALASDLSSALKPKSDALSEEARLLAASIRSFVTMARRNPAEQLPTKPTPRRVLQALLELGGEASHAVVRERLGYRPAHFSNILKPLSAHGFVRVVADAADAREKRLLITSAGRLAVGRADARRHAYRKSYVLASEPRPASSHSYHSSTDRRSALSATAQ